MHTTILGTLHPGIGQSFSRNSKSWIGAALVAIELACGLDNGDGSKSPLRSHRAQLRTISALYAGGQILSDLIALPKM